MSLRASCMLSFFQFAQRLQQTATFYTNVTIKRGSEAYTSKKCGGCGVLNDSLVEKRCSAAMNADSEQTETCMQQETFSSDIYLKWTRNFHLRGFVIPQKRKALKVYNKAVGSIEPVFCSFYLLLNKRYVELSFK